MLVKEESEGGKLLLWTRKGNKTTEEGTLSVFDIETGKILSRWEQRLSAEEELVANGNYVIEQPYTLIKNAQGTFEPHFSGEMRFTETSTGRAVTSIEMDPAMAYSRGTHCVSLDGKLLLAVGDLIVVYDVATGQKLRPIALPRTGELDLLMCASIPLVSNNDRNKQAGQETSVSADKTFEDN